MAKRTVKKKHEGQAVAKTKNRAPHVRRASSAHSGKRVNNSGASAQGKTAHVGSHPWPLMGIVVQVGIILVMVGAALIFSIWSKNNFLLPKEAWAESVLLVIFAVYVIKVIQAGTFALVKSDLWFPLAAFVAISFASLIHSVSLYLSLLDLAEFLAYFLMLFLTINFVRTHRARTRIFWVLLAVCIIASVYALAQFYNLEFKFWARQGGRGNIFSTFGNPNRYSGFVAAVIPGMIGYLLCTKGLRRYIIGFTIALSYTGVMMTFTRGALLGLIVSLMVMVVLIARFKGLSVFRRQAKSIAYVVIVFAVIGTLFSTSNPINTSNQTVAGRAAAGLAGQEVSVRQRLMIWDISLLMVKDRPFIGQGIGTYKYHYLWYQGKYFDDPGHDDVIHLAVWAREAHNEYVQILAELGIIGFAIWMWLLFTFFRGRYKTFKQEREEMYFFPRLGFTMGALVILVHALVSFPLHIVPNGLLLFLLMGLAASGWRRNPATGSETPGVSSNG